MTFNATLSTIYNVVGTTEKVLTRPPIYHSTEETWIDSCVVTESNENDILVTILTYGIVFTLCLILKGMRTFHLHNKARNPDYHRMSFLHRVTLYFKDCFKKRNIYLFISLHIWNQATDLGVVVEMYYLSYSACTIDLTLLYRLFALGLMFILLYRFVTAVQSMFATQRPNHFMYQLLDLLIIKNLELNYLFDSVSIDEVQTWLIYSACTMQSFTIMVIAGGIMTLTQGYYEHPFLLLSFILSFLISTYSIVGNDRIIYSQFAHTLQLNMAEIKNVRFSFEKDDIISGYCCYFDGFRLEYVYRVLFRGLDYQFRIFMLVFIWTAVGGIYLALYLLIECIILYNKARQIGRYQLLSGLLGIIINYTSPEAKRFSNKFAIYRFITNFLLLILIFICINVAATDGIPISDPYEQRRSDFVDQDNMQGVYYYLCCLAFINPWLYFGAVQGGDLIRSDEDASTNARDPFCIIANKDFDTFLHLIVFGNIFYHGNEWVLQRLLDVLEHNIYGIAPQYIALLLSSHAWDFTKISYYTKSAFFASIMRINSMELCKLLFDRMIECRDIKGVEAGLLYWCKIRDFNENNKEFGRIIALIHSKFVVNHFNVVVQSSLLKYTILRAAHLGDLKPFHSVLAYRLSPAVLSHLYLHYTDFKDEKEWNADIFADILHKIHHVKTFTFNVDNLTAKCFLYWALKFEIWETLYEQLQHKHHSKQVYSKFDDEGEAFLHLVCKTPCDYQVDADISMNVCNIADICINKLYNPLNEGNKSGVTALMYACQMLHIPLIESIVKYGPITDNKDLEGNDCRWYIEHNYWVQNDKIAHLDHGIMGTTPGGEMEEKHALIDVKNRQITFEDMEKRKQLAFAALGKSESDDMTEEEDDFIESYEERYDEFIVSDQSLHLYRSTKHDLNVLFEAIQKQDFQNIIDLIDEHDFDANMPTIDGTTPLHFACVQSGALVIKYLMDRGAFPFNITKDKMFPIQMLSMNTTADDDEQTFMNRLLDVRDVDHDPFALTDERVIEIERIQSFGRIFLRYMLLLFAIFVVGFCTSAGLTDSFDIGYISPL